MNIFNYVKNTIRLSVPVAVAAGVLAYVLGYSEVSMGIFIGLAGGIAKALMLTNSVLHGSGPVKTFLARYALIGCTFVAGAMISLHAFFAASAAVLFTHVLFIMDQIRTDKAGEIA